VSLYATERLPQPYAVSAAVSNDVLSRTLVVRLPEKAGGYEKLLWRQAYQAYRAAEENGWSGGTSPLWATALGADRLAYAMPGDLQTLKFHFEVGKTVYSQLIAKPVAAIVKIDRSTSRFGLPGSSFDRDRHGIDRRPSGKLPAAPTNRRRLRCSSVSTQAECALAR
jgi:hypothetical protein